MRLALLLVLLVPVYGQSLDAVKVATRQLARTIPLTGELRPYQQVDLKARVPGFVEKILVDRGSAVKAGQTLVVLSAPEMEAQVAREQAEVQKEESRVAEAKARLATTEAALTRVKKAAETPGAVAGLELVQVEQQAEAARGVVRSAEASRNAAAASLQATEKLRAYLSLSAPFAGVVTERYAHPGALAGPSAEPLLRIEQVSRLRLVASIPEQNMGSVRVGQRVRFKVAAYPDREFASVVARLSRAVEEKTRATLVELDVNNTSGLLAPGMYPELAWPVGGDAVLAVPLTAVATTTERVFVVRVREGKAEWVDVRRGARLDGFVQVSGALQAGDTVLLRGTDEVRPGSTVQVKIAK